MTAAYDAVASLLRAHDLPLNVDSLPSVIMDESFVEDSNAVFPASIDRVPPLPYVFHARLIAVVAKGDYTPLRLDFLKNGIREALDAPFKVGTHKVTAFVVNEADTKDIGIMRSVVSLNLKVEHIGREEMREFEHETKPEKNEV